LRVKTNKVFEHLQNSDKRITIEQGGSRSGKTYNILIWLIFFYCERHQGHTISIVRKTFPSLRASVMRDFFEILEENEQYIPSNHNRTNHEYQHEGNLIEFVSLDQPQKVRGRKRQCLFINEANELHFEDWQQLIMRTEGKVVIDYNPSDAYHWIYDKVIPRDDADFYKTTYKNNPFLDDNIKAEIERLRYTDEDYWRIYGLGERGATRAAVFQFAICDEPKGKLLCYGLDFGYTNDPSALVAIYKDGDNLYIDELLYHTHLTNPDISDKLHDLGLSRRDEIFADSAEPKSIEELYRLGWNVKPASKGADSVRSGIDALKRHKLYLTKRSTNAITEFQNYRWKEDKNGNLLRDPIDQYNHAIDATRYATQAKVTRPNYGVYALR
jgi:phage terminase large subunit